MHACVYVCLISISSQWYCGRKLRTFLLAVVVQEVHFTHGSTELMCVDLDVDPLWKSLNLTAEWKRKSKDIQSRILCSTMKTKTSKADMSSCMVCLCKNVQTRVCICPWRMDQRKKERNERKIFIGKWRSETFDTFIQQKQQFRKRVINPLFSFPSLNTYKIWKRYKNWRILPWPPFSNKIRE